MPSKNFHVCDFNINQDVKGSDKRKHEGKSYTVRYGEKGEYAYYYPIDEWTEAQAKAHCKEHDGKFEPALKETQEMENKYINPKTNPLIRTGEEA